MLRSNHAVGQIRSLFLMVGLALATLLAIHPQRVGANEVYFDYDELGRVIQAFDSTAGKITTYQYDEAGNRTAVATYPASTFAITDFYPKTGPVGTTVTIIGSGFTGAGTVYFGTSTTKHTPTVVSDRRLKVVVKSNASSGKIKVVKAAVSIESLADFTVLAASPAPLISSFSPASGPVGQLVTVSGSNFMSDPDMRVTLNQASVEPLNVLAPSFTSFQFKVPDVSSGTIKVSTPFGSSESLPFYVFPAGITADTQIDSRGTIKIGSSFTQALTVTQTSHVALWIFEGAKGDLLTAKFTNNTFTTPGSFHLTVLKPSGEPLVDNVAVASTATSFQLPELPSTGTYTLLIDPDGNATGSVTVSMVRPTLPVLTLDADPSPRTPSPAGQRIQAKISLTAGMAVSFVAEGTPLTGGRIRLLAPNGIVVAEAEVGTDQGQTLMHIAQVTGDYQFMAEPGPSAPNGPVSLSALAPRAAALERDATSPVSLDLRPKGRGAVLTFTGPVTEILTLGLQSSITTFDTQVLDPTGAVYTSRPSSTNPKSVRIVPTSRTGTYKVLIQPQLQQGNFQVSLLSPIRRTLSGAWSGGNIDVTPGRPIVWSVNVASSGFYSLPVERQDNTNDDPFSLVLSNGSGATVLAAQGIWPKEVFGTGGAPRNLQPYFSVAGINTLTFVPGEYGDGTISALIDKYTSPANLQADSFTMGTVGLPGNFASTVQAELTQPLNPLSLGVASTCTACVVTIRDPAGDVVLSTTINQPLQWLPLPPAKWAGRYDIDFDSAGASTTATGQLTSAATAIIGSAWPLATSTMPGQRFVALMSASAGEYATVVVTETNPDGHLSKGRVRIIGAPNSGYGGQTMSELALKTELQASGIYRGAAWLLPRTEADADSYPFTSSAYQVVVDNVGSGTGTLEFRKYGAEVLTITPDGQLSPAITTLGEQVRAQLTLTSASRCLIEVTPFSSPNPINRLYVRRIDSAGAEVFLDDRPFACGVTGNPSCDTIKSSSYFDATPGTYTIFLEELFPRSLNSAVWSTARYQIRVSAYPGYTCN